MYLHEIRSMEVSCRVFSTTTHLYVRHSMLFTIWSNLNFARKLIENVHIYEIYTRASSRKFGVFSGTRETVKTRRFSGLVTFGTLCFIGLELK